MTERKYHVRLFYSRVAFIAMFVVLMVPVVLL